MKIGNLVLIIFSLSVLVIVVVAFYRSDRRVEADISKVVIGTSEFKVEIANTPLLRSQGLSGRDFLDPSEGMLFIFESPGKHGFWMKDMKIPIDIIWIQGDRIVGYVKNAPIEPNKSMFNLTTYRPPVEVDKVLEINGGLVDQYGIGIGQIAEFQPAVSGGR